MGKTKIAEFEGTALYKQDHGEMYTVSFESKGKTRNLLLFRGEADRFREAMEKKDKFLLEDALYRVR